MPCPRCTAPDLQNAQANFCFHCGYALTNVQQPETKTDNRPAILFAIVSGMHVFMSLWYLTMSRFISYSMVFYRVSSIFFLLCELTLLILTAVVVKHPGLRVIFIVIACLRMILTIGDQFLW